MKVYAAAHHTGNQGSSGKENLGPRIVERRDIDLEFAGTSLWGMTTKNRFRRSFMRLVHWKWFDRVVMAAITINCILLAMTNPLLDPESTLAIFLTQADLVFTILFTVELCCKVIAMGVLFNSKAYLKDSWNRLDFVIVVAGWAGRHPSVANVSPIRMLRVLRPLRAINHVEGVKILVNSLLSSLPMISNAVILIGFIFYIFAVIGIQLFSGIGHQRCVTLHEDGIHYLIVDDGRLCANWSLGHQCEGGAICRQLSREEETWCDNANRLPNYAGQTRTNDWDNLGSALMFVFQCITLDNWSGVTYKVMDGYAVITCFLFIFLTLVGSFFSLNLFLAVISNAFSENTAAQNEAALQEESEQQSAPMRDALQILATSQTDGEEAQPQTTEGEGEGAQEGGDPPRVVTEEVGVVGTTQDVRLEEEVDMQASHGQSYNTTSTLTPVKSETRGGSEEPTTSVRTVWLPDQPASPATPVGKESPTSPTEKKVDWRPESTAQWLANKPLIFHKAAQLMEYPPFQNLITGVIAITILGMATEHHDMSETFTFILEVLNAVVSMIFLFEVIVNVMAQGPKVFFFNAANLLDFFIVMASLVEVVFWIAGVNSGGILGVVKIFRAFRLVRVFKIGRFRKLLLTILASLSGISYLTLLLILFIFIFAVLGMQLFAGQFDPDFRSNFDNLYWSLLTVFQLITLDSWTSILWNAMRSNLGSAAILYFLLVIVVGNYIFMNLFIAILLQSFSAQSEGGDEEESTEAEATPNQSLSTTVGGGNGGEASGKEEKDEEALQHAVGLFTHSPGDDDAQTVEEEEEDQDEEAGKDQVMSGVSFGLFQPTHVIRVALWRVVKSKPFELTFITLAVINCVIMTLDDVTVEDGSTLRKFLDITDIIFTSLFGLEMLLKMLVWTVYQAPNSYLRDSWNRLDGFIVFTSLVSYLAQASGTDASVLRVTQALKPARVVSKSAAIRVVIAAIAGAMPPFFNVLVILLMFWLIFGIFGMQLFSGRFGTCTEFPKILVQENCEAKGGKWENPPYHFDNIIVAMRTLFECALMVGWRDTMNTSVDAAGIDEAPRKNAAPWNALFFLVFLVMGSFFLLNVVIGVVLDSFNTEKQKRDGTHELTKEQRDYLYLCKQLSRMSPEVLVTVDVNSVNPIRKYCIQIVHWRLFEHFIIGCIMINMLFLSVQHYQMNPILVDILVIANLVFVVVFSLEAVIKIIAFGPMKYSRDAWNKFDFVVCVASLVGLFVETGVGASMFRVFRIGRVFRLVNKAPELKQLFSTLIYSLPALYNIGALLLVLFFSYSILGMNLWGKLDLDGELLHQYANFRTFPVAMFTLYRVATTDNWPMVFRGCMQRPKGNSLLASLYFISFLLIGSLLMLNLFIAVILESFSDTSAVGDVDLALNIAGCEQLTDEWSLVDHEGDQQIGVHDFIPLMQRVGGKDNNPVGFNPSHDKIGPILKSLREIHRQNFEILLVPHKEGGVVSWEVNWQYVRAPIAVRTSGLSGAPLRKANKFCPLAKSYMKYRRRRLASGQHVFTLAQWYAVDVIGKSWRLHRKGELRHIGRSRRCLRADSSSESSSARPSSSSGSTQRSTPGPSTRAVLEWVSTPDQNSRSSAYPPPQAVNPLASLPSHASRVDSAPKTEEENPQWDTLRDVDTDEDIPSGTTVAVLRGVSPEEDMDRR